MFNNDNDNIVREKNFQNYLETIVLKIFLNTNNNSILMSLEMILLVICYSLSNVIQTIVLNLVILFFGKIK